MLTEGFFLFFWVGCGDGGVGCLVAFFVILALVGEGVRGRGIVRGLIFLDSLLVRVVGAIFGWVRAECCSGALALGS